MAESIGSFLKRERELRRIPLDEICQHTKIKLEYLEAIESDHFEKIPGLIFAKGYLRSYADYVGLNAEEVLLRFEDLAGSERDDWIPPKKQTSLVAFWLITFLVLILTAVGIIVWLKR